MWPISNNAHRWDVAPTDPDPLYPTPTLEQARLNPTRLLQGANGADGERRLQLGINDRTLFARFDGTVDGMLPDPPNFDNPTRAEFQNWHTYFQLRYLAEHGQTHTFSEGTETFTVRYASFGTSPDPNANYNVVLSQDGRRVITLGTLQLNEIAAMPAAEQRALAALPLFRAAYATPFGLVPTDTQDANAVRDGIKAEIDLLIARIESVSDFEAGQQALFDSNPLERARLYHYLFTAQLDMIKQRLDTMYVFAPDMILAEYTKVFERFERLNAYMTITAETASAISGLSQSVNALDGLQSVRSAQEILKGVEVKLYELARTALTVAQTGLYEGRRLDTPNLVFVLQTFQSYANEAEAEARTEEMNQLNRLLQDYTALQRLLNNTLNKFDPLARGEDDDPEELGIKGLTGFLTTTTALDASERRVISMFDRLLSSANSNSYHPLEVENGVTRPTEEIVNSVGGLRVYTKEVWDKFAINVSEATKLLNQDSQIRMDEIASLNRQKNRSYDVATSTLSRMSDILRSIIN